MPASTLYEIDPGAAALEEDNTKLFGSDITGSDYGLLLQRLKYFVCGVFTYPTHVSGVGSGKIHSYAVTDPSLMANESWSIDFSDDTNFTVTGSGSGLVGTLALAAPAEGVYRTAFVTVVPGVVFTVTEGDVPFSATDEFTFSVTPPVLGAQGFSVVADTATGYGFNNALALEVLKYTRDTSANTEVFYETFGQYGTDQAADDGNFPVDITKLVYYDNISLRKTFYIDFFSATQYRLKDSAGVILQLNGVDATGTLEEFLDYRSDTFSVGLIVHKVPLSQNVYSHAAANSNGVLTVKYSTAAGAAPTARTTLRVAPPRHTGSADNRVTRCMILKSTGLLGGDEIYYSFCQRVGGANDGDRWYIDCQLMPAYNPDNSPFAQVGSSPPARIIHHQGSTVRFMIIADGRGLKILSELPGPDYQVMMAGFFLPHATPTSYVWPGYVAGTLGNGNLSAISGFAPTVTDHSPGFNPGVKNLSPAVNGFDKSSTLWVCLPTGDWVHGANFDSGNLTTNPSSVDLSEAPSSFQAVYTSPWIFRAGPVDGIAYRSCRISCNTYGDPAGKVILPGMIMLGNGVLDGIIGEFPGVFFVGQSPTSGVSPEDIIEIDAIDHIVWAGTTVPSADAAVYAAFSKE